MSEQHDPRGEPTWSDPWYPPTVTPQAPPTRPAAQPPPVPPPYRPPVGPPPGWPPGPYPPPYPGAPHPGSPYRGYPPARRTNSNALIALILGIVSLVMCQPLGLVAFFLGRSARREIEASHGAEEGDGMALAGQIIGMISFAFFVLGLLFLGALFLAGFFVTATNGNSGGGLSV